MDKHDLDRLAYAGAELPASLSYADTLYFLMLRALYRYAKQTGMSTEQGKREKGKIEDAVRAYRADQRLSARQAEDRVKTSAARAEYRKARMGLPAASFPPQVSAMLSAADRMAEALDHIPIERGEADEKRDRFLPA